ALLALERAPEHEAVAHVDHRPLAQVGQREAPDAGGEEVLDAVRELPEVGHHERDLALPASAEEEQEAIALALVPGQEVALAEAVLHPLEEGLDLGVQRLEGRASEAPLDVGEGGEVHEDDGQAALLAEDAADLLVHVPERRDDHGTIFPHNPGP